MFIIAFFSCSTCVTNGFSLFFDLHTGIKLFLQLHSSIVYLCCHNLFMKFFNVDTKFSVPKVIFLQAAEFNG